MFLSLKQNLDQKIKQFRKPKKQIPFLTNVIPQLNIKTSNNNIQPPNINIPILMTPQQTQKNSKRNNDIINSFNSKLIKKIKFDEDGIKKQLQEQNNSIIFRKQNILSTTCNIKSRNDQNEQINTYEKQRIKSLEIDLNQLMQKFKKVENDYNACLYFIQNLQQQIQGYKKILKELQKRNCRQELESVRIKQLEEKLNQRNKQYEQIQNSMKRLQYDLDHQRAINNTHELKYKSLKQSWQSLINLSLQKGQLKRLEHKLQKRCKTLQQQSLQKTQKMNEMIVWYQKQIEQLKQKQKQKDNSNKKQDYQQTQQQYNGIMQLKQENFQLNQDIQQLKKYIQKLKKQFVQQFQQQFNNNWAQIQQKNKQLNKLLNQLSQQQQKIANQTQKISKLQSQFNILKIQHQKQINTLNAKLHIQKQQNSKLLDRNQNYQTQIQLLIAQKQSSYNLENLNSKKMKNSQSQDQQYNNCFPKLMQPASSTTFTNTIYIQNSNIKQQNNQNIYSNNQINSQSMMNQFTDRIQQLQNLLQHKKIQVQLLQKKLTYKDRQLQLFKEQINLSKDSQIKCYQPQNFKICSNTQQKKINKNNNLVLNNYQYDIKIQKNQKGSITSKRQSYENQLQHQINNFQQQQKLRNQQYYALDDQTLLPYLHTQIVFLKFLINKYNLIHNQNKLINQKMINIQLGNKQQIQNLKNELKRYSQYIECLIQQRKSNEILLLQMQDNYDKQKLRLQQIWQKEYQGVISRYEQILRNSQSIYKQDSNSFN